MTNAMGWIASLGRSWPAVVCLLGAGLAGCLATGLGLDGANAQQLSDFQLFYFPAMQDFASDPIGALSDYSAAPTPLYYFLQGLILRVSGLEVSVRIASVVLGLIVIGQVLRFPASRERRLLAAAAMLISPYFRGQVWYANGDILALSICLAVLSWRPITQGGWLARLGLASVGVYVRQNFIFLPAYVFIEGSLADRRRFAPGLGLAAVSALPLVWLVSTWGGLAPPRFVGHLSLADLPATLAVGLTICAVYLAPVIVLLLLRPQRLLGRLRALPALFHVFAGLSTLGLMATADSFGHVLGGGLVFLAAKAGSGVLNVPVAVLFLPAYAGALYSLALFVAANPRRNTLVLAAALSMSISIHIYQRYFDPLIPLLILSWAKTPELIWLERRSLLWTTVLPSLLIAVVASITH
jgi:hypothetical protein